MDIMNQWSKKHIKLYHFDTQAIYNKNMKITIIQVIIIRRNGCFLLTEI